MAKEKRLFIDWAAALTRYTEEDRWSPEDLARVVALSNLEFEPTADDMSWLASKTNLLPPRLLAQLDEKKLIRGAPKTDNPDLLPVDSVLMSKIRSGSFTDDEFKLVYVPRTNTDLAIRRARASTVYRAFRDAGRADEWAVWIPQLVNLDYITVCNLMLAELIHTKWLRFWASCKCLRSLDDLQMVMKNVSDRLKKFPAAMETRLRYCEAAGLSGYRNPPFGDFDFVGESEKLADGGAEHGVYPSTWIHDFTEAAREVQGQSAPEAVPYMTLEQYIGSDLAQTNGASSYGRVEWEFEGEKGKFKARKNFLLDIATPAELAAMTIENMGKQSNVSFIKSELGKMRIAVTGDLWGYFAQSWLNYLAGGVYLQWPGNTLDETVVQQAARMQDMRESDVGNYTLPFDFAAFDHQPSTEEIQILTKMYVERGASNVPTDALPFWRIVVSNVVESFANSVVIVKDKTVSTFRVKGGLGSGIRLTSLLGNYWNPTMTLLSKKLIYRAGLKAVVRSWLRGDDSAIVTTTYWAALAMRLAYAAINAVGNDSKYGIHYEQTEFLRVWYGPEKNFGYPNRAIPGLMQRKPWSSEPWDPEGVIKAQISVCDTLERRLSRPVDYLRRSCTQDWSRIRGQSSDWLAQPACIGGLGVTPFRGKISSKAWPHFEIPPVVVRNLHVDSWQQYQTKFPNYVLSQAELLKVQAITLESKLAADDVRGLGKVFRDKYKDELKKLGVVTWRQINFKPFPTDGIVSSAQLLSSAASPADLAYIIRSTSPLFGAWRRIEAWWSETQLLARVRKIEPAKMLQAYSPAAWSDMRKLERAGLHRASALDYIFGNISGIVSSPLSPLIVSAIQSQLSTLVDDRKWTREMWAWFTSTVGAHLSQSLDRSPVSVQLYQW